MPAALKKGGRGIAFIRNPQSKIRNHARRALTLLEVIIAISLIIGLLSAAMAFFWQTMKAREQVAAAADKAALARQVLSKLTAELEACVGSDQVGFPVEQRLVGTRRGITFLTTALPDKNRYHFADPLQTPPPAAHDLTLLSYSLWVDPENKTDDGEPIVGGIIRTEKKTLNQFTINEDDPLQIRNDLWSPELAYLEFRFYDGVEWDTKWEVTQGNGLPQLVQITVGFKPITEDEYEDTDLQTYSLSEFPLGDDLPHEDRYTTIVRIPAADRFFGSRVTKVGQQFSQQLGVGSAP